MENVIDWVKVVALIISDAPAVLGTIYGAGSAHSCTNYNDAFQYVRWRITDWVGRGNASNKYCAIGELYVGGKYAS